MASTVAAESDSLRMVPDAISFSEPPSPLLAPHQAFLPGRTDTKPSDGANSTFDEVELIQLSPEIRSEDIRSPSPISQRPLLGWSSVVATKQPYQKAQHQCLQKSGCRPAFPRWSIVYIATLVFAIAVATFSGAAALARLCSDSTVSLLEPVSVNVNLTLSRAKILDFVFSAVIIPLILAVFNFTAFQLIRTSALQEYNWNRQSVPVVALVELSTTNWGSYSPFKFWYLVSSKDVRCILTAIAVILAAISYSCLTNIVGYQAAGESMHNKTLDYLSRPAMEQCDPKRAWFDEAVGRLCADKTCAFCPKENLVPELPENEQVSFFKSGLIDAIENIADGTTDTARDLIQINTSLASLAYGWPVEQPSWPIPDIALFTLANSCTPLSVSDFALYPTTTDRGTFGIITITDRYESNYTTVLPFNLNLLQEACVSLVGFRANNTAFVKMCPTNQTYSYFKKTDFGDLPAITKAFDWTQDSLSADPTGNQNLTMHGISCLFHEKQGHGVINREQKHNRSSSVNSWLVDNSSSTWKSASKLTTTPLLWQLQLSALFSSPYGMQRLGGLGSIIASTPSQDIVRIMHNSTYDWGAIVSTFIFLEGSVRSLVYNAVQNETFATSNRFSGSSYEIHMRMATHQYTMTYVPWLVLASMTALLLAALLTLIVTASSLNSEVFRKGRLLDPLRMVMDLGNLFEPETFSAAEAWSESALAKWSKTSHVRYRLAHLDKSFGDLGSPSGAQSLLRLEKADVKGGKLA